VKTLNNPEPRANPYGTPLLYPGTTGHLLDHPILVPVQVQKRNNVLKIYILKKSSTVHETYFLRS
jgi:hypothetical protein